MKTVIRLLLIFTLCLCISCRSEDSYSSWVKSCIDKAPQTPITIVSTGETKIIRDIDYQLLIGAPLPEFEGFNLEGEYFDLAKLKGKLTVINFWSMGCAPCLKKFEELNKLVDKYENEVNFLSITSDKKSSIDSLIQVKPFSFDIIPDAKKIADKKFLAFWTYPFFIIADQENRIIGTIHSLDLAGSEKKVSDIIDFLILANLDS